jgi:beta-glucanase (GH16 family)
MLFREELNMKNLFCSIRKNGKQMIALFAMLCFIIGNAAFIPAVEANAATIIKSVVNPADFYVDNQTSPEALQKALPKKVGVVMSNGAKSTADVTWNIKGYVSYTKTTKTYDFTGAVKGTKLTAKIKVILSSVYVTSIKAPAAISVINGTSADKLNLPKTVTVVKSNKTTAAAKVAWDTSKYNGNAVVAANFVLVGNVEGTEKISTITVKVGAPFIVSAAAPTTLTVDNGTTISQLFGKLPSNVTVKLSNGLTRKVNVTWNSTGYNGNVDKETTYTLSGKVEGTNQVTTTINVKVSAPGIVSITKPTSITLSNGASLVSLQSLLPKTVEVMLSNGNKDNAKVTWNTSSYDPSSIEGKNYLFTGTVQGSSKTTEINVYVSAGSAGGVVIPTPEQDPWTLTWSDEFNGENGTSVDSSKWDFNLGNGANGWGNNEFEYYTNSTKNVYQQDGNLVIKPIKETLPGVSQQYTSGRILTQGKFYQKYGKFEARMKLPVGKGFWPAFWLMPESDVYGGWAASGELDIMEARGGEPTKVAGTLHHGASAPNNKYSGKEYTFTEGETIGEFHTYSVEWEPGEIRWYVDGRLYQTQNNWSTTGKDGEKYAFPAPFDQEFFVILNLAVGGNYIGKDADGNYILPGDSEFANDPKMEVDYVRVYELNENVRNYKTPVEPNVNPEQPPVGARVPDANGNLVYDTNFENGIKENAEGLNAEFGDGWNFVHNAQFNAVATASVEQVNGKNFAKINVTNQGTQTYAVQLEQLTTLTNGRWYEFSFDAKADRNRTLNAKLGGGPTAGWSAYSDSYTVDLNTDVQSFKNVFQMTKASDILTRIEFNCAASVGTVWIGNVKVVEVAPPVIDYNRSKAPLSNSGNHIYNGAFDKYTIDRMSYWNINSASGAVATANVPEATRELNVNIVNGGTDVSAVTLDQKGIQLKANNDYVLTFKARAAEARTAKVKIISKDTNTEYLEKDIELTTTMTLYKVTFKMTDVDDLEAQLKFLLGGNNSKVFIDDVVLLNTTVDYTGLDLYPLENGDFSRGMDPWVTSVGDGAAGTINVTDNAIKTSITNCGTTPWAIQLIQNDLVFKKGVTYIFSFDARSTKPRKMEAIIENATWTRYVNETIEVGTDTKKYEFEVIMPQSDTVNLKFLMGKTNDAVVSLGAHDIYIDNVVCQVKDAQFIGSVVKNGRFTEGVTPWENWNENGDYAVMSVENEALKLAVANAGSASYSVQAFQQGLKLAKGKTYEVSFKAKADEARKVLIKIGQTYPENGYSYTQYSDTFTAALTGAMNQYSYNFTMNDNDTNNGKITFEAGSIDGVAVNTTVYIDDVFIVEKTPVGPIVTKTALKNKIAQADSLYSGLYTAPTWTALQAPLTSAKAVNAKADATQEEVDAALAELTNAINQLVIVPITTAVINGNFNSALAPSWENWTGEGGAASVTLENGAMKIAVTAAGTKAYSVQAFQQGLGFINGKTYVLTFKAKADAAKKINVNIGKALTADPWFVNYMTTLTVDLSSTMQEFTKEFTMSEATYNNAKIVFEAGLVAGQNIATNIYIDDVSIVEKTSSTPATVNKTDLAAKIAQADALNSAAYTTASWTALQTALTSAKAVNVNAAATQAQVDAELSSLTTAINGLVAANTTPVASNLVVNGDFATNTANWTIDPAINANLSVENGMAKIQVYYSGTNPWDIQLYQEDLILEPNVKYNLTFDAKANKSRKFEVDVEGAGFHRYFDSISDDLTTELKHFSYEVTITNNEPVDLKFFFGKIDNTIASSDQCIVYLDNIVLTKAVGDGGNPDEGGNNGDAVVIGTTPVTLEAENATNKKDGVTVADNGGSSLKSELFTPMWFEFSIDVQQAGNYEITYVTKCSPNGAWAELQNGAGAPITAGGVGTPAVGTQWMESKVTVALTAGVQTIRIQGNPGAASTLYFDKIIVTKK